MKYCRLCGVDYPDEAQFCLQCGKSLEYSDAQENEAESEEYEEESSSFTPSGSYDADQSYQSRKRYSSESLPDYATCMREEVEQAAQMAESWDVEQEQHLEEHSEISQDNVVADLSAEKKPCARCGAMNPHNQIYCVNCGAEIDEGGVPEAAETSQPQYQSPPPIPPTPPTRTYQPPQLSYPTTPSTSPGDCFRSGTPTVTGRRGSFPARMMKWSAWTWAGLISVVVIFFAAIWFFFYGGMNMVFSTELKNMGKADAAMAGLSSYEYTIDITYDSAEKGQFKGEGKLLHELPDKTSWAVNIMMPGSQVLQPRWIQIGENQYVNNGAQWQQVTSNTQDVSAKRLWTGYSSIENLGDQSLYTYTCNHYKYRIPSDVFRTVTGMTDSQGIGDAVMEIWIDIETKRIMRMTANVYGLLVGGVKANAVINMELSGTGLVYNLQPPVQ
ncbi:MAG: zinc ribbon domain-containing protein [Actinobacteria bacterium]|nr:zinc ribbon domain-containing protein [Actinomycetota bacterium]